MNRDIDGFPDITSALKNKDLIGNLSKKQKTKFNRNSLNKIDQRLFNTEFRSLSVMQNKDKHFELRPKYIFKREN